MSNLNPFLAAMQAAYDTHQMPDDVHMMSISRNAQGFTVWTDSSLYLTGHGNTLAEAYQAALAKKAEHDAQAASKAAARAALEAAGLSPDLIAA